MEGMVRLPTHYVLRQRHNSGSTNWRRIGTAGLIIYGNLYLINAAINFPHLSPVQF